MLQIQCPLAGSLEDALGTQSSKSFPRGLERRKHARWTRLVSKRPTEKPAEREGVAWAVGAWRGWGAVFWVRESSWVGVGLAWCPWMVCPAAGLDPLWGACLEAGSLFHAPGAP